MFLTQRALTFRRAHAGFFREANYVPLQATGTFAESVIAFARHFENRFIVIIAPRLSSRVGFPPIGEKWQDTAVDFSLSTTEAARDIFTGRQVPATNGGIRLGAALAELPFALITNIG